MVQKSNKFKVSVIFPSYNESENVREAIQRTAKSLGKDLLEIIIVDDNSPDGTWKVVKDMKNPKYRLIRRMNERGLASAIARGIKESKGNFVVWLDCDLGVPPEVIPKLVEKLNDNDVAIASRYVKGGKDLRPKFRAFLSVLINLFANLFLSFKIRDFTSGVIAVRKNVFNKVKFSNTGFGEYFIEFVYKCIKNNYKIVEVGYVYRIRKAGVSKTDSNFLNLLRYGITYSFTIVKLRITV